MRENMAMRALRDPPGENSFVCNLLFATPQINAKRPGGRPSSTCTCTCDMCMCMCMCACACACVESS